MQEFERAKIASKKLRIASEQAKNQAIEIVSKALLSHKDEILEANAKDVAEQISQGAKESFIDRLTLTSARLESIASDMIKVACLADPIGKVEEKWIAESGIEISKVLVPFGVIGVIYEARPNVTVDVFTLCLKTSNACLLKGGKDAKRTNEKLVEVIREALTKTQIDADSVILLPAERQSAEKLIKARGLVDLIVPRGGKGLIEYVVNNSLVPVIETGAGVCHTYVHKSCDKAEAIQILKNAKMSRPSVCNACETLLVDKDIAKEFLGLVKDQLNGVTLRGDLTAQQALGVKELYESGYKTEYGSYELSVKIVNDVFEAIDHVNEYGTHHSDCICARDENAINSFYQGVDSACVYANASTRFSDGGCFGFGAELGISTQKTLPRGPMGLKEMTTYQYRISGKGQVR